MSHDSNNNFKNLDPQKIVDTIERLNQRVSERFPDAGLADVCSQLHDISENMKKRAEWIGRPVYWLRAITWFICVAILLMAIAPFYYLAEPTAPLGLESVEGGFVGFVTVLEAGLNDIVLIGAAIFFFLTFETRYKRQRALKAIHELRTVAHIIDMHQLTKDPHRITSQQVYSSTELSPKLRMTPFQLRRYLDYCSEMLALTGKIAAVYVQEFDDGVALASASELETLTAGLSNKIWQKISILENASSGEGPPGWNIAVTGPKTGAVITTWIQCCNRIAPPLVSVETLEYCSEMMALTGKIAAVYVQGFDDGVALASASELETLTAGLSNKIWQKISILETASAGEDPPGIQTV